MPAVDREGAAVAGPAEVGVVVAPPAGVLAEGVSVPLALSIQASPPLPLRQLLSVGSSCELKHSCPSTEEGTDKGAADPAGGGVGAADPAGGGAGVADPTDGGAGADDPAGGVATLGNGTAEGDLFLLFFFFFFFPPSNPPKLKNLPSPDVLRSARRPSRLPH